MHLHSLDPTSPTGRVWAGHKNTSVGMLYTSPIYQGTVLTLQIDVLQCGEDVGSDFKMPSPNMTAMVETPS